MKRCRCGHAEDEHSATPSGQNRNQRPCLTAGCVCPDFIEDEHGEPEPKLRVEGTGEPPDDVA